MSGLGRARLLGRRTHACNAWASCWSRGNELTRARTSENPERRGEARCRRAQGVPRVTHARGARSAASGERCAVRVIGSTGRAWLRAARTRDLPRRNETGAAARARVVIPSACCVWTERVRSCASGAHVNKATDTPSGPPWPCGSAGSCTCVARSIAARRGRPISSVRVWRVLACSKYSFDGLFFRLRFLHGAAGAHVQRGVHARSRTAGAMRMA